MSNGERKAFDCIFMTILSLVCAYFGDMIFDFFTAADIGAAMGFLFPTLVVYWISRLFPDKE